MNQRILLALVLVLLAAALTFTIVDAQGPRPVAPHAVTALAGTAFTYQGQLKNAGALVNGTCGFLFGLWDAVTGGSQIGVTQTVSSISVTNGLFTTPITFTSDNAFIGEARWLQSRVRCPDSGSYTTLDPRQALNPVPIALSLPGLYTLENSTSPNVVGGYNGNTVVSNVVGGTISGGGSSGNLNRANDNYTTVGGGLNNRAGSTDGNVSTDQYATVGGGQDNHAATAYSTVAGGWSNTANSQYYTTVGGGYGNTASGSAATIPGGYSNTASGNGSVVSGQYNTGSATASTVHGQYNTASAAGSTVPGGQRAVASHSGEIAYANGRFAVDGDAQTSTYVLRGTSTTDSLTNLYLDGVSAKITISPNRVVVYEVYFVGVNASNGTAAGFRVTGFIKNIGGTTSLSYASPDAGTFLGSSGPTWYGAVYANDSDDTLEILVQGVAGQTIRWVATVHTVEVAY